MNALRRPTLTRLRVLILALLVAATALVATGRAPEARAHDTGGDAWHQMCAYEADWVWHRWEATQVNPVTGNWNVRWSASLWNDTEDGGCFATQTRPMAITGSLVRASDGASINRTQLTGTYPTLVFWQNTEPCPGSQCVRTGITPWVDIGAYHPSQINISTAALWMWGDNNVH